MVRAGCFGDVDVATCWHPAAFTGVNTPISLVRNEFDFFFQAVRRTPPQRPILAAARAM